MRRFYRLNPGRRDGKSTRILVTGASGLLGNKIVSYAVQNGHEVYSAYQKNPPRVGTPLLLDLTEATHVEKAVSKALPDAIINSAAMTDVDMCEQQPDLARRVNSIAVSHLANSAKVYNVFLIQVSTDYVFDGEKGLYTETDLPSPVNEYGRSKLEGEEMAKLAGDDSWAVARASVVYGWGRPQRSNAATYVHDRLTKGEQIKMVKDQFCSPTYNDNLARMVLEIAEKKLPGVLNTSGASRVNRYDFAVLLAKRLELDPNLIVPVETGSLQWKAKRPRDSSLNVGKAMGLLNEKPVSAEEGVNRFWEEAKLRAGQAPIIGQQS